MTTDVSYRKQIREVHVSTRRLGRHIHHDPRSLAFAIKPKASTAHTTTRKRLIPILDQGNTGSCTGNAETGALGSEGLYETANPAAVKAGLKWDESLALTLYARATVLDGYKGTFTYPPPGGQDTGSDGLSANKAAQQLGLSSGYVHALSVDAMITGLQTNAGIMGVNWYDSFDSPAADGILTLPAGAKVRGGHEIHALNVNMELEYFEMCNSWGTDWALAGHFYLPFTVAERLLGEDGDATFPTPLTAPPTPSKPIYSADDLVLRAALDTWGAGIISKVTKAGKLNEARKTWEAAHA